METMWPSPVNDEIKQLESELHLCLEMDTPIDTLKLKRLCSLREDRLKELVSTHQQRTEVMKEQTRKMTAHLIGLNLNGKPDIKERLLEEQDKYDIAASHWVSSETCLWGESEAASIAAGILILADEIR